MLILFRYYLVVTQTLILSGLRPKESRDIPAWSLASVFFLWNRPCRIDGKTFQDYLLGNPEIKLPKWLLRQRILVLLALYLWPIAAIFIIWKHKGQRLRQWHYAIQRPDLYVAYPTTLFDANAIAQRRSDMFLGIFNCWDYYHHPSSEYEIDRKDVLEKRAAALGLPVIQSMSLEQAKAHGGPYIVKIAELDMGLGIQRVNAYEALAQFQNEKNILIQPLLLNHPALRNYLPDAAPLSTLRLITTLQNDAPICHHAEFRIGPSGGLVDNICRGGIPIEMTMDGVMIANSIGESASSPLRTQAPGASSAFSDVQVPFFREAVQLAQEAHECLAASIVSIGWDLALTKEGPLLIEANVFAGSREVLRMSDAYSLGNEAILRRIRAC